MKRTVILLCVLVFGSINQAVAENGDHFWLLKGGMMWLDKPESPDSMNMAGLTYGYGLSQRFSIEIDYDRTFSGGKYSSTTVPETGDSVTETGEYKLWLASLNIAYRHLVYNSIYVKAKVGYVYGDEARSSDVADADKSNSLHSIVGQIGLGYLAGSLIGSSTTIELSYARFKQDMNSVIVGINLTF